MNKIYDLLRNGVKSLTSIVYTATTRKMNYISMVDHLFDSPLTYKCISHGQRKISKTIILLMKQTDLASHSHREKNNHQGNKVSTRQLIAPPTSLLLIRCLREIGMALETTSWSYWKNVGCWLDWDSGVVRLCKLGVTFLRRLEMRRSSLREDVCIRVRLRTSRYIKIRE